MHARMHARTRGTLIPARAQSEGIDAHTSHLLHPCLCLLQFVAPPLCEKALFCIPKTSFIRRHAIIIAHWKAFEYATLLAIIANCITLALDSRVAIGAINSFIGSRVWKDVKVCSREYQIRMKGAVNMMGQKKRKQGWAGLRCMAPCIKEGVSS
eukprot:scaffold7029_cov22-Tisochrysis_lutea.AAC.2